MRDLVKVFVHRRMATVLLLGFCSGLPLSLTGSTLQAWMTEQGADVATIGRLALVGLPYTAKFVWSPLLDSVPPPFWGRRRGWAFLTQLVLVACTAALAFVNPTSQLELLIAVALLLAFASASQDIVVDAFRTELVTAEEVGAAAGIYVMGYRLAMLASGALALILADHLPWRTVYLLMAALMALASLSVVFSREPERPEGAPVAGTWRERAMQPFAEFFGRAGAMEILLFVMVYKLSTMMATALTTPFLLGAGFSKTEIGTVSKVFGLIATIVGTLAGGALMTRIGTKKALWMFGVLQALAGLSFIAVSIVGYSRPLLIVVITVENFMLGLGVAALQGFMMAVCSRQFTATQFALLSSLTAVSRVVLVSQAGVIAERIGWTWYFVVSVLCAVPGLLLLLRYDAWQSLQHHVLTWKDKLQAGLFVAGLGLIASEGLWSWLGHKSLAAGLAWAGAGAVGASTLLVVVPVRRSAALALGERG